MISYLPGRGINGPSEELEDDELELLLEGLLEDVTAEEDPDADSESDEDSSEELSSDEDAALSEDDDTSADELAGSLEEDSAPPEQAEKTVIVMIMTNRIDIAFLILVKSYLSFSITIYGY